MITNNVNTIYISNFEDLQLHLINIEQMPGRVEIDLTNYQAFIRPLFIVTVAQFIRYLRLRGHQVVNIILPRRRDISNYLSKSIGFIESFKNNFEPSPDIRCGQTSLPLMSITQDTIPDKKTIITQFLNQYCFNKDLSVIQVCLDEILNNCFDHAVSQTGVIAHGQYLPNLDRIRLAICDTGIGIPTCVNNYFTKKGLARVASEDAIRWAFEQSNTTMSTPANRGRGLHTLHSAIEANGGSYRVITHDKWLLKHPDIEIFRDTSNFFGTAIEFELTISDLPDLEFDDFDYDF